MSTVTNNPNVFPTPAASTTTPSTSDTSSNVGVITNQASLNTTENQFLTLLTTQLQNQDPTSPMDTSQFTSELVSMSGVEQQLTTNQDLSQLVTLGQNNQTQLGLSYMGMDVSVDGSEFTYNPASDTSVTLGYSLPSAAASNQISVLDSSGNVVYTGQGSLASGANTFTWNGSETNGTTAPAGNYTIQVAALSAANVPITATTQVPGQVTGMQTTSTGTVELVINNDQVVPLSSVTSATLPPVASSSTTN